MWYATYRNTETGEDSDAPPDYPVLIESAGRRQGSTTAVVKYRPARALVLDDDQLRVLSALAEAGMSEMPWAWSLKWPGGCEREDANAVLGELESELRERETPRTIDEGDDERQ